jgi:hypothetical protein
MSSTTSQGKKFKRSAPSQPESGCADHSSRSRCGGAGSAAAGAIPVFIEGLEPRCLLSGATAVVAERRQIILADLRKIHLDFVQLTVTATVDLRAAHALTRADQSRIGADMLRLRNDEDTEPGQVSSDLTQLEFDQGALRADIISARQTAIADRNVVLTQLNQDRHTLWGDVATHGVQPPAVTPMS